MPAAASPVTGVEISGFLLRQVHDSPCKCKVKCGNKRKCVYERLNAGGAAAPSHRARQNYKTHFINDFCVFKTAWYWYWQPEVYPCKIFIIVLHFVQFVVSFLLILDWIFGPSTL